MKKYLLIIIFFIGLQSCISFSSIQTARITAKDDYCYSIAIGTQQFPYSEKENGFVPGIDLALRYGINRKIDAGIKLNSGGLPLIDAKFQIIGNDTTKFASSIGLGTYLNEYFMIPFYFSYYPTKNIGIYFNPKMIADYSIFKKNILEYNDKLILRGTSIGFKYGDKKSLFLEYSIFYDGNNIINQYAIGFGINIK
jgi:hypothetical protein